MPHLLGSRRLGLFACASAAAVLINAPALAQDTGVTEDTGALEEVVVTATRQTDTVNRVPLSISAATQQTLDQQGIKSATDLQRIVPALTLVNETAGVGTFAIRGIVATTGAATTGVYLDDTALTKRNNPGVSQNNGAPLPILFDLERVEVLKGPQGTLYGGSSQGGTIRFITPTPSLTRYSALGRAEVSTVKGGEESYDLGLAAGGPIVQDKLGFRVSGIHRTTGGHIDVYNPYTSALVEEDANSREEWALRGALRWQITDRGSATLAWYRSSFWAEGGPSAVTRVFAPNGQVNPGQTYTTPATCYNNTTRLPGATSAPAAVACPTGALPAGWHRREAQTYGPFNYLGDDDTISPLDSLIRDAWTQNEVGSLTLDYDFGSMTVKSITSYVHDRTSGDAPESHDAGRIQTTLENPGRTSFPLFRPLPIYQGRFISRNKRHGIEQEIRFASAADARPLSWVAGVFYSNLRTHIDYKITGNYDQVMMLLYGLNSTQRYGIPNTGAFVSTLDASLKDVEVAAFGEANYWVTDRLRLTAGLRASRVTLDFYQENYGQLSSRPNAQAPFGTATGSAQDAPLTPKVGAQYQLSENDMVYVNAAKGFRAGGVNVPLNPQVCSAGLALFGLTVNDIPTQYGPDVVWSYEAGGKFRLMDNRLQLNAAVFQIDWQDIQVTTSAQGCGQNWNQNGGTARSRGFDLQVDYRPVRALTLNAALGYTDAKYSEPVLGPRPLSGAPPAVTFNEGDPVGVPKWQVNVGARFDFDVGNLRSYIRADYQFQGEYTDGPSFGTGNYNPFTRYKDATDQVNVRAGVNLGAVEVNVFANNLLDSRDEVSTGPTSGGNGQTGCNAALGGEGCTVYTLFSPFVQQQYQRPRSVGVQANYRF